MPSPTIRYESRQGPLRILVVGGSLGAAALNDVVPAALALIPETQRDSVNAWRQEYEQKTGEKIGDTLLRTLLRSSKEDLKKEIIRLEKPKGNPLDPTIDQSKAKADSLKANIYRRAIS